MKLNSNFKNYITTGNNNNGFSLVELMVVLSIIGIIVSLALPKFKAFQVRTRQIEAKTNLNFIYTLQVAYHTDNNTYSEMPLVGFGVTSGPAGLSTQCNKSNGLGFSLSNCRKVRYTYEGDNMNTTTEFDTYAYSGAGVENRVSPGCSEPDFWIINANNHLQHDSDVLVECPL